MGYEEVHIEYSTAPLLPTFPRGTPSDQPSVDYAAAAAPRAAAAPPRFVKTIAPLHSLREVGKPYSTVYKVYLTHWIERIVLYLILEVETVTDFLIELGIKPLTPTSLVNADSFYATFQKIPIPHLTRTMKQKVLH